MKSSGQVSSHLLKVSSRLVSWGMLPLALGLCIDLYLVAHVITRLALVSIALAVMLALVLAGLWLAFPQWQRHRRSRQEA